MTMLQDQPKHLVAPEPDSLATAQQAGATSEPQGPPGPGEPEGGTSTRALVLTTLVCLAFAVGGHAVLWWAYADGNARVPWQPVVGIALAGVAVASFGGFYAASRRSRIGVAAGFLLTFLVLLTYALTIEALPGGDEAETAGKLLADFRWVVATVILSFFGTEGAVGVTKVRAVARTAGTTAEVVRADRDLVTRTVGSR